MTYEEVTKEGLIELSLTELITYYSRSNDPQVIELLREQYPNDLDIVDKIQELVEKDV